MANGSLLRKPPSHRPGVIAALLCLIGALSTAAFCQTPSARSAPSVDALALRTTRLADEYVAEFLRRFPQEAELQGLKPAPDSFPDNSLPALRAWHEREDRWADQLRELDASALRGRPEWVTLGFLKHAVESSRQLRVCRNELWPVNQMLGWPSWAVQWIGIQEVGTPQARAAALARWERLPRYLDTEIQNLRLGVQSGYTTPRHNVELVIEQLDRLLATPLEQWPFFSPARRDSDPDFELQWTSLLVTQIKPAIEHYRTYLLDEYRNRARTTIAISAHPDGVACYQASLRAQTTLDRSGAEVFQLGQAEVERNLREALEIGRTKLGATDLHSLVTRIAEDPANRYTSREQQLAFTREFVARAAARAGTMFQRLPRAGVTVEPFDAMVEKQAGIDAYDPAAADGSRPATHRVALYWFATATRSNTEVTAAHESYPGHHVQIGLAAEVPAAHPITLLARTGGFAEGWGRYSEALAEEMQLYSSDYARANRRLWPARGMVIDPGIHLFGWTRDQAVAYAAASGRFPGTAAEALIDRAIVWPGQLTAYDSGALEIVALRKQAQDSLGERFDIREFHGVLLGSGGITLPMLRDNVAAWLAAKRTTTPQ